MKYTVYVTKIETVAHTVGFLIEAINEKEAKKEVKERIEGTCLAERLRYEKNISEEKSNTYYHVEEFFKELDSDLEIIEPEPQFKTKVINNE